MKVTATVCALALITLVVPFAAFTPAVGASGPDACVTYLEVHDVERRHLCVDSQGECAVYEKVQSVNPSQTCLVPGASTLNDCYAYYELHDVERRSFCVDTEGPCLVSHKVQSVNPSETCVIPGSATAASADWPRCERVLYGPDIDSGVCVDPARDYCQVYTYAQGPGPYQERCFGVLDPEDVPAAPQHCEVLMAGLEQEYGACVDATQPTCPVYVYRQWWSGYEDTCYLS